MSIFNILRQTLTVKRPAAGTRGTDGRWVEGTVTEIQVKASVQPANADDLQVVEEARRTNSVFKLYTDTKLQSLIENSSNPDIVVIDGVDHEVMRCDPWRNNLINHYRALVGKVQK